MLEFYEAYSDYTDMMELTEDLIIFLARSIFSSEKSVVGEERPNLQCNNENENPFPSPPTPLPVGEGWGVRAIFRGDINAIQTFWQKRLARI